MNTADENVEVAATEEKPAKKSTKKVAKKDAKKVAKEAAHVEEGRTRVTDASQVLVKLEKTPPEDELPKQAFAIINVLKENGRKLTLDVLLKKLEKVVTTKQPIERIFQFYRPTLVSYGFISIAFVG